MSEKSINVPSILVDGQYEAAPMTGDPRELLGSKPEFGEHGITTSAGRLAKSGIRAVGEWRSQRAIDANPDTPDDLTYSA